MFVSSCEKLVLLASPFYPISFLPGNLTPALLRSYHRKVVSPSDGHEIFNDLRVLHLYFSKKSHSFPYIREVGKV